MKEPFRKVEQAISNGWRCHAVSTMTPGIVRIQLGDGGLFSDLGYRTSVEGETLEEALEKTREFCSREDPESYFRRVLR